MEARRDIVRFVEEVSKHECIYNVSIPDYSNRHETKRAWNEIADVMQCSESECKEKWRKIRIAFTRSLKQARLSNQTNKPYYLYDYLTFLLPHLKVTDQHDQEMEYDDPSNQTGCSDEEEFPMPNKTTKIEFVSDDDNSRNKNEINGHVVYFENNVNSKTQNESHSSSHTAKREEIYVQDRQRQIIEDSRKRRRMEDVENNPRKMFLLSILPDVEAFTEEEMRVFRRSVVTCIDDIMDKRNT